MLAIEKLKYIGTNDKSLQYTIYTALYNSYLFNYK